MKKLVEKYRKLFDILELLLVCIFFSVIGLILLSCEDKYLTVERNIIDSSNKIPVYFTATAEQGSIQNHWSPVFKYYIYSLEQGEGRSDAFFHAYVMMGDSVIFSGVQPITLDNGKTIYGEYRAVDANFSPELIVNSTPMAYVSVEY